MSKSDPSATSSGPIPNHTRSAETRAAILEAAARIFAEGGLAGARTEAIAEAAGVNKALLYYYFKNKEALYFAAIEAHLMGFTAEAMKVLTAEGSPRTVLLNYVSMHFDFISQSMDCAPLYQQLMMNGDDSMTDLLRRFVIPRSQALQNVLERGMQCGEFRPADKVHTSVSIIALIVFYFTSAPVFQKLGHSNSYSETNLQRRKQEAIDFIRYGIFTDPNAPLP